jgi:membrane associated rhomboid family serine protease
MTSTPISLFILAATALVSIAAFNNGTLFEKALLNPYSVKHRKEYARLMTHMFVHVDWLHLIFNMYTFWSFGTFMEQLFTNSRLFGMLLPEVPYWGESLGRIYFAALYLLGGLAATLPAMRKHGDNVGYNSVGASGAVSAVLMAFMIMFPTYEISFFLILPMPAFIGALVFFGMEHWLSRSGRTNIAHDAHIWGALFGLVFVGILNPEFYTLFVNKVIMYVMEFFQ